MGLVVACVLLAAPSIRSQDWPQWRGPNRDARATGFKAPKTWPDKLNQKWQVSVGSGVASPALVGDRLYVFTRQGDDEVIRCLDAATGKEAWNDKYPAEPPGRPASGFANEFVGPRASPTVSEGKVVTLGVRGVLSCYDAASGKKLWRKDDIKGWPRFFTSSSPIIVDGLCIAQLGGKVGGIVAYDLATGNEKWKWTGDGPGYASPVLLTVDGTKVVVAETNSKIVALGVEDGKLLWETAFAVRYNACTPLVDGQTVIYSGAGKGTTAVKLEKKDSTLAATEKWHNENGVQFNTPVLAGRMVYGISDGNSRFCVNVETGKTAWTTPIAKAASGGKGKGRKGGGGGGYGSIVAAGDVLLSLTPQGQLVVFQPSDKGFKPLASYKVADGNSYAYPIVSGNRIFVQDKDSLTLWTIE
jgi:outer membrane protein assembly factor BamB